jgi:hypothetical protein
LDKILTELDDNSPYVEYWSRQEWRNIEAHADIDEFLAKAQDADASRSDYSSDNIKAAAPFRYPDHGHVLYLQVGSNVRGPTCIFPKRSSGGDLLRPINININGGHVLNDGQVVDNSVRNVVELVTVPAVPGRLVRFEGKDLHAVPRPTDLWLLKFVQGAPKYEPEVEWGRSVILFNTWSQQPPQNVPLSSLYAASSSTTKNSGDSKETLELHSYSIGEQRSKWTHTFSLVEQQQQDNSTTTCSSTESESSTEERPLSAKVWLLGNERRRDHPMRTLKLAAPERLREALNEETKVHRLLLEQTFQ